MFPLIRFAARHSYHWAAAIVAIIAAALLLQLQTRGAALAIATGFPVLFAIPYAAIRILDYDRDGRLDQLRLAGTTRLRLLGGLLVGSAAPWLALSAGALLVSAAGGSTRVDVMPHLTVLGASAALSLMAIALPRRALTIDLRLAVIALGVVSLTTALWISSPYPDAYLASFMTPLRTAGVTRGTLIGAGAALELAIVALCAHRVLQMMARPAGAATGGPMRRPAFFRRLPGGPLWRRGVLLCGYPAVWIGLMTITLAIVLRPWLAATPDSRFAGVLLATLFPLVIGVFVASSGARGERLSGRLDLTRMSALREARGVVSLILGVTAPFLLASAVAAFVVWVLLGQQLPATAAGLRSVIQTIGSFLLLVATLVPAPFIEGCRNRWPLVYTWPALFVYGSLLTLGSPAITWTRALFGTALLLVWVPWLCAVRVFHRPEQPPLAGWAGALFAGGLAMVFVVSRTPNQPASALPACAWLLAIAPLIVAPHGRQTRDDYAPAIAAGLATAARVAFAGYRAIDVVLLAAAPAIVWAMAVRITRADRAVERWTTAALLVLAVWMFLLHIDPFPILPQLAPLPIVDRTTGNFAAVEEAFRQYVTRAHAAVVGLLIATAMVVEIVIRVRSSLFVRRAHA